MIRQMVRRPVGKLAALAAVLGVVSTGTPSLFAAAASEGTKVESPAAPPWFVQVLNGKGEVVVFDKAALGVRSPVAASTAELPGPIDQLRQELQERQKSANPKAAGVATRLLRWLDIAGAKTASERHEKIRKLPVTITTSPATDGRDGIVKNYVANGKTRMRRFIPSVAPHTSSTSEEDERLSGPTAEITERWTSEAQEGETCYDNEPGPCATEEEMEDYDVLLAQTQYELESYESEYNGDYNDYSSFCNSNPSNPACQEPDTELLESGPSACEFRGCWGHAAEATGWLVFGFVNLGFRVAARAAAASVSVRLAAAAVSASTAALIGSAFMVGWYIGSFIDCMFFMYSLEADLSTSYWYEPVYDE